MLGLWQKKWELHYPAPPSLALGSDKKEVLSLLRSVERGAVDTLREQLVALAA